MTTSRRLQLLLLALALASTDRAAAQEGGEAAADRNGAANAATHKSTVRLKPLEAWAFVQRNNAAYVAAREAESKPGRREQTAGDPATKKRSAERPAGAGRYVCAVLACADLDASLPEALGLKRKDVLVLRAPGPFVSPEDVAMLERTVRAHRIPLILMVGHRQCDTIRATAPRPDALTRRVMALRQRSRRGQHLHLALLEQQRALLLASSELLQKAQELDEVRVLPALFDPRRGALTSTAPRALTMPIRPVK